MSSNLRSKSDWTRYLIAMLLLPCLFTGVLHANQRTEIAPIAVQYHLPTDVFNLLDNLPDWLPGYTASAYGDYWRKNVGMNQADRKAMLAYAAFRLRTSPKAEVADSAEAPILFAPLAARDLDPFARYFFEAPSFAVGMKAAIAAQSPQDQAILRNYYGRFLTRALRLVETQSRFGPARGTLESQLASPAVSGLAAKIRTFYGAAAAPTFVVRFVWWPDPETTQAKVRGRYILLQSPVSSDASKSMDWAPITMHEFSHYMSAGQPAAQKKRLTAALLERCPSASKLPNPLNAIEEPLAIYWGQVRFEQGVRKRALSPASDWYIQPHADRAAKAIARAFPATGPAPMLEDSALIAAAASACSVHP